MMVEFENLKTFKFLRLKYSFAVDFVLHNEFATTRKSERFKTDML